MTNTERILGNAVNNAQRKDCADILDKALAEERDIYPLTSSQMTVYYICHYNPEGTMYDNPFMIRLDEDVDIDRLKTAWQKVVENHSAFNVEVTKNEQGRLGFKRIEDGRKSELYSFEIKDGALYVNFNHIIFDGISWGVILRELSLAYEGEPLEPEAMNPLKMGIYEELMAETAEYERCHNIYKEMFEGKDCDTMLPYDMPETDEDDIPCKELTLRISGDDMKRINDFIAEKKITGNNLFMWAYQRVLAEVTGKRGVHFCIAYHGRSDVRMSNAVGMFIKTVPVYLDIDREADINQQLKETKQALKQSIIASEYPYAKVADEFGLEYRNAFVFQGGDYTALTLDGKPYPMEVVPVSSAQTDLMTMVHTYSDCYDIRFTYRSDCYKEETIKAFADRYIQILTSTHTL